MIAYLAHGRRGLRDRNGVMGLAARILCGCYTSLLAPTAAMAGVDNPAAFEKLQIRSDRFNNEAVNLLTQANQTSVFNGNRCGIYQDAADISEVTVRTVESERAFIADSDTLKIAKHREDVQDVNLVLTRMKGLTKKCQEFVEGKRQIDTAWNNYQNTNISGLSFAGRCREAVNNRQILVRNGNIIVNLYHSLSLLYAIGRGGAESSQANALDKKIILDSLANINSAIRSNNDQLGECQAAAQRRDQQTAAEPRSDHVWTPPPVRSYTQPTPGAALDAIMNTWLNRDR